MLWESAPKEIPDIEQLLNELERLAPTIDMDESPRAIIFRNLEEDESINDALDDDMDEDVRSWIEWQAQAELPLVYSIDVSPTDVPAVPLVAVDTGVIRLGETEDGLIIALRGTVVKMENSHTTLNLYRTGPLYLRNQDKPFILRILGRHMGNENIFVEIENDIAIRVKSGVADHVQAYSDRFRNWFERILQRIAARSISHGLLIVDGALTTNTRDTPTEFFRELVEIAESNGNTLIGISKQSRLQIQNRAIRFWLSERPYEVCYRRLSGLMPDEMRNRIIGATYAIRFSPMGSTFRVDIKPVPGQTEEEAIDLMFANALMRGGYPDLLVQAHTHCYFTTPQVTELKALCKAKFALKAEPELDFGSIFGPFGGRFK